MMIIKRRATVSLSLLCAVFICAIAAQSAVGAAATNTTPITCTEGAGAKDFSDSHCDTNVGAGNGKFGHSALPISTLTFLSVTNAKTQNNTTEANPAVIKGTIFGVKTEFTCKTGEGSGSIEPRESGKIHFIIMLTTTILTSCTVNKPAGFGCKVEEPIEIKSNVEGVEGLGAGKNEHGLEFKPSSGETFAEITVTGCIFKGTNKITGTAIATGNPPPTAKHSGTTSVFTNAMTKETLKLAGNPVEISAAKTFSMAFGGGPIGFTTTT